jgi:hypothetical protein
VAVVAVVAVAQAATSAPPSGSIRVAQTAAVAGLLPGAATTTSVRVTNGFGFVVALRSVTTSVTVSAARRGCTAAGNIVARPVSPLPTRIAARRTTTIKVSVAMPASAADSCQNARFSVAVRVTASR